MTGRSHRPPPRPEPREVVELRLLRQQLPELAPAVDLQLAQLDLFRRAQSRVPLPQQLDSQRAAASIAEGRPMLAFADVPINWSDFRWVLRETVDLLRRFDLVDAPLHAELHQLMREGHTLEPRVEEWFTAALRGEARGAGEIGEVFAQALKPFLARCAEVWIPRLDLSRWMRGSCPLCGGAPEIGVITTSGERCLLCARCTGRWPCPPQHCPWCASDDASRHTTLTTPDGRHQLDACERCRRYLKSVDERGLGRPVLPWVDTVATMPLDAAAMQRGYEAL